MNTITTNRTAGVLAAVSAIVLAAGAVFCAPIGVFAASGSGSEEEVVLRVCNWEEYIDLGDWDEEETIELESGDIIGENSMVKDFEEWYEETYGIKVKVEYSTFGTNEDLYNMLTLGDEYDLVCPSEYMFMKLMTEKQLVPLSDGFFDPSVEENYYAYKRMEFSKTIGTYPLDLPPLKFKTKGLWFTIPDSVKQYLEDHYDDDDVFPGGLHGAEHALIGLFSLHVMCDRFDIGGLSTNYHEDTQEASIFIYDAFEGGIGICEKAVEVFKDLTESTRQLLKTCQCENGCPSCIYSPKCGNDNKPLHKKATEYVLDYMHEEMNKLSPEELNDLKRKQLPNPYDDYENEDLSALYSEIFKEDKYYEMESSKEDYSKLERELNSSGIVDYADIDSKLHDENDSLPEFSEEELLIRSEYEDALEEFNKGNYSSAKDILNDILIKTDKINADAYYLIGKILYVQGDKKGAVSFVKKAISLEGAHEEANDLLIEIKKDLKS